MEGKYSLTLGQRKYRINLERISSICFTSSEKEKTEREITEGYEIDESGEFHLTSKINREITPDGGSQEDAMMYDFVKTLITLILECDIPVYAQETQMRIGVALAFNTLLAEGIIEEITE